MKDLETDALISRKIKNSEDELIDLKVLRLLEEDLEPYEKISLLFLISDDFRCYDEIRSILSENPEDFLCKFVEKMENWQEKMFEALCITKSIQQIRKLGKSFEELSRIYLPTVNLPGSKVHWGAKMLFKLFDDFLGEKMRIKFLEGVYEEIERPEELGDGEPLEMHAFYWLKEGYITLAPDECGDLKKIKEQLEKLGLQKEIIYLDFERFCNSKYKIRNSASKKSQMENGINFPPKKTENSENIKSFIESAYVLIINEVNFKKIPGQEELEARDSSTLDVKNIKETFGKFDNYSIKDYNNVTFKEMKEIFEGLKEIFASGRYGGLFVWILSHGVKGHFTDIDGKDIPYSFIQDSMCIRELRNLPKVAIVQACQGKKLGVPDDVLTYDGPGNYSQHANTEDRKEFLLFSSTMEDFKAIRSKKNGSWFINACCEVIPNAGDEGLTLSLHQWTKKVKRRVAEFRGELEPGTMASQLAEVSCDRFLNDFYFPLHSRKK